MREPAYEPLPQVKLVVHSPSEIKPPRHPQLVPRRAGPPTGTWPVRDAQGVRRRRAAARRAFFAGVRVRESSVSRRGRPSHREPQDCLYDDVYAQYVAWSALNGSRPKSKTDFDRDLTAAFPELVKHRPGSPSRSMGTRRGSRCRTAGRGSTSAPRGSPTGGPTPRRPHGSAVRTSSPTTGGRWMGEVGSRQDKSDAVQVRQTSFRP